MKTTIIVTVDTSTNENLKKGEKLYDKLKAKYKNVTVTMVGINKVQLYAKELIKK